MNRVQESVTTIADFEWWFEHTPGGARNIYLAELEGKIVGCLALVPYEMTFDGRAETVGFGQRLCVDAVCRGRGVFLSMQKHLEEVAVARGMRLFLGFPNVKAHGIWTRKWDVLDLPRARLLVRVERPAALLERARVPRKLASLANAPFRGVFGRGRTRSKREGYTLTAMTRFDATADALWNRISKALTRKAGCITRNAAYLNWRYFDGPVGAFRATGAYAQGHLVGYVVTGSVMKAGIRLGVIADMLALPDRGVRSALLDHALAELRESGVDITAVLEPIDPMERFLCLSRLLLPSPKRFPIIGKALDSDRDRVRSFLEPHRLRFTLGDLDFV